MKFKCNKCETEFEAKITARCPSCGETMNVTPIKKHRVPI